MMDFVFIVMTWLLLGPLIQELGIQLLHKSGLVKHNYRGEQIPVGLGIVLWLHMLSFTCLVSILVLAEHEFDIKLPSWLHLNIPIVLMLTIVFLAGWIDDKWGDPHVKGIRGHIRQWWDDGTVSTGLLKLFLISFMALWGAIEQGGKIGIILIQFVVIALSANTMNLLDLRPGRALKAYFLCSLFIILYGLYTEAWHAFDFTWSLVISAFFVLIPDMRGRAMLGDMGANLLGFHVGYMAISTLSVPMLLVGMAVLAWLHIYAERCSISTFIERVSWLAWLDQLGTTQAPQRRKRGAT